MTEEEEKALKYLSTPVGFAEGVLGLKLHPWQAEVVNEFSNLHGRKKVAVSTPNGAGKSSIVTASVILRTLSVKPQARVICTSGDMRQLDSQLWPALERHFHKFEGWQARRHDHFISTPENGFFSGYTTDDPRRAEGYHADFTNGRDSPVVIIVDEAKSVNESIFEAFSARCTFNALFYVSSTGLCSGTFYRAMTGHGGFKRYSIGLKDCPHISKKRIDELLEEYADNLNHPLLQSTLYGKFMSFEGADSFFVGLEDINHAIESPPLPRAGDTVAFCDFGGGSSENVLAIRRGNRVRLKRCWKEFNEMSAVGQFIRLFVEERLAPEQIWGDNSGFGKPIVAAFYEAGWPIQRFNGGAEAYRSSDFANRNAEILEMAGREIKKGLIDLDKDPKLHSQMVNRHRTADSKGRICAESKTDMAKRGVDSPDRADAVMAAIAIKSPVMYGKYDEVIPGWADYIKEELFEELIKNAPPGSDLGNQ